MKFQEKAIKKLHHNLLSCNGALNRSWETIAVKVVDRLYFILISKMVIMFNLNWIKIKRAIYQSSFMFKSLAIKFMWSLYARCPSITTLQSRLRTLWPGTSVMSLSPIGEIDGLHSFSKYLRTLSLWEYRLITVRGAGDFFKISYTYVLSVSPPMK